jgi:uncharacterized protein (DUF1330 family)
MPAYIIFIREKTINQKELEVYWSKIRDTLVGHEIKVLAAYGPQQNLEGMKFEGGVIAEFPSVEAARRWYDSPAYQAVIPHRQKGAIYHGLIVEGVASEPQQKEMWNSHCLFSDDGRDVTCRAEAWQEML